MFKNFDEIIHHLQTYKKKKVVVAGAHTESAIEAAVMAKQKQLSESLLIGNKLYIENFLKEKFPEHIDSFEIIDSGDDLALACEKSVEAVREKKGDLILKGKSDTAQLLRAVLNKENGLTTGQILSDVFVYERPDRLVLMSDGGINLCPDVKEKISIIHNAVNVAHSLENHMPKVALLSAVEVVNPKLQSSVDAAVISNMNKTGEIKNCYIDGPLAFDNAINLEAAKLKGINSTVAGDADILIVPNIESGNIFGKSLTYYCNYRVAHVVMGSKVPIIIASRADNAETKMLSIALGIIAS